jgi:hypothetical protein
MPFGQIIKLEESQWGHLIVMLAKTIFWVVDPVTLKSFLQTWQLKNMNLSPQHSPQPVHQSPRQF